MSQAPGAVQERRGGVQRPTSSLGPAVIIARALVIIAGAHSIVPWQLRHLHGRSAR